MNDAVKIKVNDREDYISMNTTNTEKRSGHYLAALLLAAAGVVLDQYTKYLASARLKDQPPLVILENIFELQYLENRGAAFGLMQGRQFFFITSVVIISMAILWFYGRVPMNRRFMPLRLCAVFIMAGAAGNCIDRVVQQYVVDFLYLKLIDFPIFNVADIYVTVATFFLAILMLFYYKEEELELIWRSNKKDRKEEG